MSSSVFIENCAQPVKGGVGSESAIAVSESPDTNLVVVYGKKGVNFDKRSIENLIEEKTLSSISVVRLTSPTPSMIEEEEEAERTEDLLRRQAEGISDDESNRSSDRNSSSADEGADHSGSEEIHTADDETSDGDGENLSDNVKSENKNKRKNNRKKRSTAKIQNIQNKLSKVRPDIVGLTVEEFYPSVSAKEVVKEALKLAGVSTFKRTADFEFQLYVIKNDHCYTPFTSPAQMKAKLAEKYKAEKHAVIGRKIIPHTAITMKQLQLKKKVFQGTTEFLDQSTLQIGKDQSLKLTKMSAISHKQGDLDGPIEGDTEALSSAGESDFDIISEESGDTDNDRDSDLDFNVNNRKGRKKKDLVTKAKRLSAGKVCIKRHSQPHDEGDDQRAKNTRPQASIILNRSNKIVLTPKTASCAPIAVQKLLSDAVAALPPIPKRSTIVKMEENVTNPVARQQAIPANAVRRGPIIEVGVKKGPTVRAQLQGSPQSVKEIAINKVMASPKGGFTEIGELLSKTDRQTQAKTIPTTPTSAQLLVTPSSSKGFMPLGVETAAKNKLPAQISIQTHQSSSELAARSKISIEQESSVQPNTMQFIQKEQNTSDLSADQFDLIVSLVKDEMQKTAIFEASNTNENIPKLVKMLENTEDNLESNVIQSKLDKNLSNFGATAETTVDDIDISNAPLLETPDGDEIPDDLLQHVVDLIEDDETLQEAVEKGVFGGNHNEDIACVNTSDGVRAVLSSTLAESNLHSTNESHVTESTSALESNQPKSIIQMAISNVPSTSTSAGSTGGPIPIRIPSIQTTKTTPSPTVRKEPIKIVRGNGRVITLPPIEAPTTRAKRRAQNQPTSAANTSIILNESSMDSSLQSNSSFAIIEPLPTATIEKKIEPTIKRRVSKESLTAGSSATKTKKAVSSAKKSAAAKTVASKAGPEEETAASQEDDDDPNRLWCICRQPHNNRFMICCDVCEDWFHGTCVSITKAMGIDMEQKGIDWTCPKCVKLQEEKTQRKITDMLIPKMVSPAVNTVKIGKSEDADRKEIARTTTLYGIGNKTALSAETNVVQRPNWLDTIPTTEAKKSLSEQRIPNKSLVKKAAGVAKAKNSTLKKKPQASNAKQKVLNTSASQIRRQTAVSQQDIKHHVDMAKSSSTVQSVTSSPQQLPKEIQKQHHLPESIQPAEPQTFCIVCKRVARSNSIYCSDDCIRKHAQNALNMFAAKSPEPTVAASISEDLAAKKKKPKGLFEDLLLMADRKPKIERVHVIDRKSGRVLTGSNAPTTINLKKWLQENQTYEVVQPGSFQSQGIEKKQKQRHSQSLSPIIISKHITQTPQSTHHTQAIQSPHAATVTKLLHSQKEFEPTLPVQRPVKQYIEQIVKTAPNSPRPGTPKQLQKYPQQVSIKPDKGVRSDSKDDGKERKEKSSKQRTSVDNAKKHSETVAPVNTNSEPIRLNVRRTLKEQLLQRMDELGTENENNSNSSGNLPKLNIEEIEKFVLETEAEMYEYFSRDTGSRYRAKYRSLMFNIKDRKNHTLFAKICTKIIQPKQLVRMSPEELASQELAKWRENEAKHQLEMIKKSELDLLSCAKNYVLKTHKGEEVIEGKLEHCVNLDATIPVEDVVSVLNSSVVSSSSGLESGANADMLPTSLPFEIPQNDAYRLDEEKQKSHSKENERERERDYERDRSRDHNRERETAHDRAHSHDSEHSREKQRRSKDRYRDKSRTRKRSRSHSRSRSRSREKRHKSYHKEEKREKGDREHEKEKFKEKERERERDPRQQRDELDTKSIEKLAAQIVNPNKNNVNVKDKGKSKKPATPKPAESYSLIDQILESTKTVEEAANLVSEKDNLGEKEKEKQKKDTSRQTITPPLPTSTGIQFVSETSRSFPSANTNDDQEPTSTVSIATPPHDPYIRYSDADSPTLSGDVSSTGIWSGNINMVDVASFQIVLQPVVGNSLNLGTLLPDELDVVGRIGPDTVWEYISKIKRSPNKEIVIIRLIPASGSETSAYKVLFQYLENRSRLGVINTVSPQIKDFYIYPLGAGKSMPQVLLPAERVDFYEDPYRPDILVGVIVRIIGKRHSTVPSNSSSSAASKSYRRLAETDSFTPPGSPKRKRRLHTSTPKVDEIDVDAIIKAPITTKSHKTTTIATTAADDANEPYSPGGSSDDDNLMTPKLAGRSDEDELKRKMEELNRQIAAQEKEIAGLLNVESSCFATTSSSKTSAVLANISIPSNLSQILASIKSKPEGSQTQFPSTSLQSQTSARKTSTKPFSNSGEEEEYNPELVSFEAAAKSSGKSSSRLAQLSEAELLSMVPDGMMDTLPVQKSLAPSSEMKKHFEEPPPPGV